MTRFYRSQSRGRIEISTMRPGHAENALAKLLRERTDDSRDEEIAALRRHIERDQLEIDRILDSLLRDEPPDSPPAASAWMLQTVSDTLINAQRSLNPADFAYAAEAVAAILAELAQRARNT